MAKRVKSIEGIKVTSVSVYPMKTANKKEKAMARVVLNNVLRLTDLRVIEGANGFFVGYPGRAGYGGSRLSVYYPLYKDLRDEIENRVLAEYEKAIGKKVKRA